MKKIKGVEKLSQKKIKELKKDAAEHIITHFADYKSIVEDPKIFVKGEGSYLYDIEGRKYLDTFASLLTTIIGHGRCEIAEVAKQQMQKLEFFPNYVDTYTLPLIELAKKLAQICPGELSVSFFVNSGSEANETAIKMAKQFYWQQGQKGRYKIVARRDSYHATTLGGSSATGIPWFREPFEPLLPGFVFAMPAKCCRCELKLNPKTCGLACLKNLERIIEWENPETVAAVIIDPIPGSNTGYPLPPKGYLKGLRELCDRHGILLIFDEVQTGFGKTGKWFACDHWNVVPDIMTLGKGLTGGYLPLGAAVTTPRVYKVFRKPGAELRSGSTYGGHTAACATTLANIKIIEKEKLVQRAKSAGAYIEKQLKALSRKYKIIGDIRGIGLLWAVELQKDRKRHISFGPSENVGGWIRDYCWKKGMILRNNGNILVLAPALNIKDRDIDFILNLLEEAISAASRRWRV